TYSREDRQTPPSEAVLELLQPGQSDLQTCLDALGAPLVVRARGEETELIWGWQRTGGWSLTFRLPLADRGGDGNFSYAESKRGGRGVTLRFDREEQLVARNEGRLADLIDVQRPKAAPLED
ncbi:MAG TPA: hypothetical protein PLJ12_07655, partial [Planctomycetota bacterium]|nr:hypothetical protein [Planctomycetota bacterium]